MFCSLDLLFSDVAVAVAVVVFLGQVQTPYFTWAESNASEQNPLFSLICIRFGSCEVRRLNRALSFLLGTLRKTRRQRQRERHKTKGLMSKTIDVHVRYNSWYIPLPSSAKQQREMTKFSVVWRTWPQPLIFPISVRNWMHSWHTQQGQVSIPTDTLESSN